MNLARLFKIMDIDVIEKMKKEMLRRRLSHRTIMTYLFYVKKFLLFCNKPPKEFSRRDCNEFLLKFMNKEFSWMKLGKGNKIVNQRDQENKVSVENNVYEIAGSTLNVALNSLRFMMEEVLRKSMRLNIKYSKVSKKLPLYLTKTEIKMLLSVISNKKHKLLVSLMYGAGLRVSEAVKLKLCDIWIDESIGWVRHGKGNKDRPFIIPDLLKEEIKLLIQENQKNNMLYLFSGNKKTHLSVRSVQVILSEASKRSGVHKKIHPHTLRHSFATHILEDGADIIAVQSLLGHNEARTTLGYLHMAKPKMISVKSPYDSL
jgi:integrase/recombinase XerD